MRKKITPQWLRPGRRPEACQRDAFLSSGGNVHQLWGWGLRCGWVRAIQRCPTLARPAATAGTATGFIQQSAYQDGPSCLSVEGEEDLVTASAEGSHANGKLAAVATNLLARVVNGHCKSLQLMLQQQSGSGGTPAQTSRSPIGSCGQRLAASAHFFHLSFFLFVYKSVGFCQSKSCCTCS